MVRVSGSLVEPVVVPLLLQSLRGSERGVGRSGVGLLEAVRFRSRSRVPNQVFLLNYCSRSTSAVWSGRSRFAFLRVGKRRDNYSSLILLVVCQASVVKTGVVVVYSILVVETWCRLCHLNLGRLVMYISLTFCYGSSLNKRSSQYSSHVIDRSQ
jgi:hypothetical protein